MATIETKRQFIKATTSFLPGPALLIFGQWAATFSSTGLVHTNYEQSASKIGIALGTVLSLVIQKVLVDEGDGARRLTLISTYILVASVAICFLLFTAMGHIADIQFQGYANDLRSMSFIIAMTSLCTTLTLASKINTDEPWWWFWARLGVALVVLLGIAYLLYAFPALLSFLRQ